MKTYEGMCRGGPMDGKRHVQEDNVFRVVTPVGHVGYPFGTKTHEYRYVLGQWIHQGDDRDAKT